MSPNNPENEPRTCQVRTGDEHWSVMATSPRDAVLKAFQARPPRAAGVIVEVTGFPDGPHYLHTLKLLAAAGYEVTE